MKDFERENIFRTPDGYFEKLPNKIQRRINKPDNKAQFRLSVYLKWALSLSFTLILLFAWYYIPNNHLTGEADDILTLDNSDFTLYLLEEISENELIEIELFDDEELDLFSDVAISEDIIDHFVGIDELEDYL